MSFIIKGYNDERTIYVGKPENHHPTLTTNTNSARRFHFVVSAEKYTRKIQHLFDLFQEYTWTIFDTETGENSRIMVEEPEIFDVDEVDENKIRCNY